jgi:hypothetical protein
MRLLTNIALLVCLSFFLNPLTGQEKLFSVATNPTLFHKTTNTHVKAGSSDTLALPIIDDFSGDEVFPNTGIWTDTDVFINRTFGIDPPTIGVATFDLIDSIGMIYETAEIAPFRADYLTSKPIDLFYPVDTTIYLSFFVQPQGLGDAPEPTDKLFVEFYSPFEDRWYEVWSQNGSQSTEFSIAMIQITDSRFLQKGFRFRIGNYGSLANAYEPSLKVNADHWHIDYVYLNTERHYQDTIMNDIALLEAPGSLLLDYKALPWEHFKELGINGVKTIFPVKLKNNANQRFYYEPTFTIQDVWGTTDGFSKTLDMEEITSFEVHNYNSTFNYGFISDAVDSALFSVTLSLNPTETDWISGNDQVTIDQVFTDYYALDDGTPEAGYGIVGEGAKRARVACAFKNLLPEDSLVAVRMLFNSSFDRANIKYFNLAIWDDSLGQPGKLIYQQDGSLPQTGKELNGFQTITLDTAQAVPGTYYIGWIQTSADFLNLGFDLNNNNGENIFFSLNNTWNSSQFEGSLMIRPVFSNLSTKTGIKDQLNFEKPPFEVGIYPNPVSTLLNLRYDPEITNSEISIIDNQGRRIYHADRLAPQINTESWPSGMYYILIIGESRQVHSSKLIVFHD